MASASASPLPLSRTFAAYVRADRTLARLLLLPSAPRPEIATMQRPSRHAGFTLIELMIVVAIISILAAIALPAYQDYLIRSQVSEGLTLSTGAKAAVWDFISNKGRLPPSNESSGLAQPASITGKYVSRVDVNGTGVTVTFGNEANKAILGQTLRLSPIVLDGAIDWRCLRTTIDGRYMPTVCRR
jgi:type IV pilus assembly protein PilA